MLSMAYDCDICLALFAKYSTNQISFFIDISDNWITFLDNIRYEQAVVRGTTNLAPGAAVRAVVDLSYLRRSTLFRRRSRVLLLTSGLRLRLFTPTSSTVSRS